MVNVEISDKNTVFSRIAVAKNKFKNDKKIVIKVVFYLKDKSLGKKRYAMSDYYFDVESVGGSIIYQIINVDYKGRLIFFLNGVEVYCVDFNKSLLSLI